MHAELEAMRVQLTEAHTSLEAAQAEVASVKRDAAAKAEANAALLHRVRHEVEAPSSNNVLVPQPTCDEPKHGSKDKCLSKRLSPNPACRSGRGAACRPDGKVEGGAAGGRCRRAHA